LISVLHLKPPLVRRSDYFCTTGKQNGFMERLQTN
jgi:hypothetical protein